MVLLYDIRLARIPPCFARWQCPSSGRTVETEVTVGYLVDVTSIIRFFST